MERFEDLIKEFNTIPKKPIILPTYMEIAGQPHFENVASNILGFFFNTSECHLFKHLAIRSLLESISKTEFLEFEFKSRNVFREYRATDNKRIDIVIEFEDLVVVIENKIYHWLANDLNLYESSIKRNKDFTDKKLVFIVLSLNEESIPEKSPFVNVTYRKFFDCLKPNIGEFFVNANNQYVTFLLDFIKTIENLKQMENINIDYFNFFLKNRESLNELNQEKYKLDKSLHNLVKKIMNLLPAQTSRTTWLYEKIDIVNDFTFENVVVALDTSIDFTNIKSELWVRKNDGHPEFEILDQLQLIKENPQIQKGSHRGYLIFDEQTDFYKIIPEEFAERLNKILEKIKH